MGLRSSKRGLSGLCGLDPFASCKAIRPNESEIATPRAYRLGGVFRLRPGFENEVYPVFGFSWPVTKRTVPPRPQKIPYFRDYRPPERLRKPGVPKGPEGPPVHPDIDLGPERLPGYANKSPKNEVYPGRLDYDGVKKNKKRHLHDG
jgi:hypothetical protein